MILDKSIKNWRLVQGGMLGRIEDVLPPLQYGKEDIFFVALENIFDSHMRGVGHIPKHPHIPLFRAAEIFLSLLCVECPHSTACWAMDATGDCRRPQRWRSLMLPAPRRRRLSPVARAPPGVLMNTADGATPARAAAVEILGHRRNVVNKVHRQEPSPKESENQ
jgi:hypothetical protein